MHGGIDGFSRKVLWLKAGPSNNDPRYIANFYINFIKKNRRIPAIIRSDAGTENVIMRDLQIALRLDHGDRMSGRKSFLVGPTTANQRIERLWGTLNMHFTQFWRNVFAEMRDTGILNNHNHIDIECIRYCFLPIIQSQLQDCITSWNSHTVRAQRRNQLLTLPGKPDILYYQPELFGKVDQSFPLPCTDQAISELENMFTERFPFRGCFANFIEVVNLLTGLPPDFTPVPHTVWVALDFFSVLITVCDFFDT
ncbi:unnamed protein product [Mytilus coruscus]|uniref:Integrase core domain-containing protein n=1 Tax=Mytilus coruscus TaxID=42192 RepID=A0A6J8BHX0_MYTCO|nr:unnamed protein product [Mytilus coruscus]